MIDCDVDNNICITSDDNFSIEQKPARIIAINGILETSELKDDYRLKTENIKASSKSIHPGEQYCGIEIITKVDKEVARIAAFITSYRHCCEDFGSILSEDDLSCFIGATLKRVYLTNTACKNEYVNYIFSKKRWDREFCNVQFINFETDKGVFQLTVYNCDNGYYGHDIVIKCDSDIKYSQTIGGCWGY